MHVRAGADDPVAGSNVISKQAVARPIGASMRRVLSRAGKDKIAARHFGKATGAGACESPRKAGTRALGVRRATAACGGLEACIVRYINEVGNAIRRPVPGEGR